LASLLDSKLGQLEEALKPKPTPSLETIAEQMKTDLTAVLGKEIQ